MENTSKLQPGTSTTSLAELHNSNEDLIQQRINNIRMELDDTYNIFVNAQETLSSISFENLGERINSNSVLQADLPHTAASLSVIDASREITLVHGADNRIDVTKSLEQLNVARKDTQRTKVVQDTPELNALFKVIRDLSEGINKITSHQQSIIELNQDINTFGEHATNQPGTSSLTSLSNRLTDMSLN
uniref:Uncharacterized protein n=1 Tax=Anopheles maculatus TaxID=74869 RepID=A0A182SN65_9DIPT